MTIVTAIRRLPKQQHHDVWLLSIWVMLMASWTAVGMILCFWVMHRQEISSSGTVVFLSHHQSTFHIQNVLPQHHHQHQHSLHEHHHLHRHHNDARKNQQRQQQHTHAIPNVLIFTYSKNLLDPLVVLDNDEEVALQANVRDIIQAHNHSRSSSFPSSTTTFLSPPKVRFLTNDDCLASIQNVMGHDSPLVAYFNAESKGMFRADMCRGAALYETGGLYFDVDVGLVHDNHNNNSHLWDHVYPNTTFCTIYVHQQSTYHGNFFQAFIGSTPHNPILYRYLELFVEYYKGQQPQLTIEHHHPPLGVLLLRMAYDDIMELSSSSTNTTTTLSLSLPPPQVIQLWQEVYYRPEILPNVPPPNWGLKRACRFVVVSQFQPVVRVALYSRIAGSRQCREGNNKNKNINNNATNNNSHKSISSQDEITE